MMRRKPAPDISAAATYSSPRYCSTLPRTTRAREPQPISDRITTIRT